MLNRSRIIVAVGVLTIAAGAVLLGCSKDEDNPTGPPGGTTLNIPLPAGGGSGSAVFSTAGTTPYRCGIHPAMLGEVVVDANAAATLVDVVVSDMAFQPSLVTVKVGGTVRWTNQSTSFVHSVVNR
jgi:plastocyanin